MAETIFQFRVRKFTSAFFCFQTLLLCIGYSREVFYVNQILSYKNSLIKQIVIIFH
jgi:hypothetical protein